MSYDTQDLVRDHDSDSWSFVGLSRNSFVVATRVVSTLFALGMVVTAAAQDQLSAQPVTPAKAQANPIPQVPHAVAPTDLLGVDLIRDHDDEFGYPESRDGLLVVELDPQAGPITMLRGTSPYYLEAQFVTTQRDAIWLARDHAITDVLPSGAAYEVPYGYGALKRSLSALTLVEAMLQPHISDNQKSYEVFPLRDVYFGAALSLLGLRGELRYVDTERYAVHGQVGVNLAALAGLKFNRTYAAFALPIVLGGGIRYPSILSIIGSHWTTGAEFVLGLIGIDKDADTANAVVLPGVFHEFEWTSERENDVQDYRSDPRPYNYGVQSFYAKIGAYADFLGGAAKGVVFDIHVGYRCNFLGPAIPKHEFKSTEITYASQRYTQRKKEEETRRKELEELRRLRGQ